MFRKMKISFKKKVSISICPLTHRFRDTGCQAFFFSILMVYQDPVEIYKTQVLSFHICQWRRFQGCVKFFDHNFNITGKNSTATQPLLIMFLKDHPSRALIKLIGKYASGVAFILLIYISVFLQVTQNSFFSPVVYNCVFGNNKYRFYLEPHRVLFQDICCII